MFAPCNAVSGTLGPEHRHRCIGIWTLDSLGPAIFGPEHLGIWRPGHLEICTP